MATMTIGLVGVIEPASRSVKSYAVELSCAKYVVHESRRIDTATKPLAPTARRTGFIGAVLYNDGRQYNCCKEQTWHGFRSSPPRQMQASSCLTPSPSDLAPNNFIIHVATIPRFVST